MQFLPYETDSDYFPDRFQPLAKPGSRSVITRNRDGSLTIRHYDAEGNWLFSEIDYPNRTRRIFMSARW